MIDTQSKEAQFVPMQEARTPTSMGPSIWLILLTVVALPAALAYTLVANDMAYAVAVFMGLIFGTFILARPFVGLVIILGLIYCRPEELFPAITGMRLTLMVTAFTLFAAWIHIFVNRNQSVKAPSITLMLGLAVVAPLSTIMESGDVEETIRQMWMMVLLVILMLNVVRTRNAYHGLVTALISVTTFLGGYSLYLLKFQDIGYEQRGGEGGVDLRSFSEGSIFRDPNDLASALVPGLALVMMRVLTVKGWRKIPYIAVAALLMIATFETESRGGYLAMVVMLGVFAFSGLRRNRWALIVAAVVGVGVMAGAGARMTDIDTQDENAQSRMQFWQNDIDALKTKPIFGLGFGQARNYNPEEKAPHNTYVQALTELGPMGFFCFMGLFYYAFRKRPEGAKNDLETDQDRVELPGARLSLVGFAVAAFFLSRAYVPCLYIQCCLPVAQQIAASGRGDLLQLSGRERFRDTFWIIGTCLMTFGFIMFLLKRYL